MGASHPWRVRPHRQASDQGCAPTLHPFHTLALLEDIPYPPGLGPALHMPRAGLAPEQSTGCAPTSSSPRRLHCRTTLLSDALSQEPLLLPQPHAQWEVSMDPGWERIPKVPEAQEGTGMGGPIM